MGAQPFSSGLRGVGVNIAHIGKVKMKAIRTHSPHKRIQGVGTSAELPFFDQRLFAMN